MDRRVPIARGSSARAQRRRARRLLPTLAVATAVALAAAGCSGNGDGVFAGKKMSSIEGSPRGTRPDPATMKTGDFHVHGSVNQIAVTDTKAGTTVELVDADHALVASATTDDLGSYVFREVKAGTGYSVQEPKGGTAVASIDVKGVADSTPPQSFYDQQRLTAGYHYITTRDGTTLSATVYLPPGDGPFPTVVEYSGYDPSNPTQNLKGPIESLGLDPDALCSQIAIICAKPAQPSSLIAASMGYAVVAVNIRGTGCSGGSYDFFEPLQLLDGYDVIETVAAQPWVRGGKVGMVGLSYPGISQLFVASTQPPHLAAITPLSVFDDTARGVLAPGGIYNKGFAFEWARQVLEKAEPYGQGWEKQVIALGDTTCEGNQKLRHQNVDAVKKAKSVSFYSKRLADPVDPMLFVDKINVPVFMTGAWQDEQTGPRFVNLWNRFTNAPVKRFYAFNGAHADGLSPETLVEWKAFLDFYVAGERTPIPSFLLQFGPQLVGDTFGAVLQFPKERLLDGDFADLKTQYEAEPEVNILWDRGARPDNIGAPESTGRSTFASWPPPGQTAERWYLTPDGGLSADKPSERSSASRWTVDPALANAVTLPGDKEGQAFDSHPDFEWKADKAGDSAVFVSSPLTADTVLLGSGSADLWVRTSEPDVDLGVTISEVRPDGKETYLQSGVLWTTIRKPGPDATELDPKQTGLKRDAERMKPGVWTEARVPILPVGHVLRAGSRLRISIHTPGGDKPRWAWILHTKGTPTVDIGHDRSHPSSIVLPTVPGVRAGTLAAGTSVAVGGYSPTLPACPSDRGQPCRTFTPYTNTASPNP